MTNINPGTMVRRNKDVFSGVVDNETVAMNVENGKYYQLNKTGSSVFELLEEPRSVQSLCADLQERFQGDSETLCRDVCEFVAEMAKMGLVILDEKK